MTLEVLVTSARGKTGREVARRLGREQSARVRLGSSQPNDATDLDSAGVPTHFDWRDSTTWSSAAAGVDAVYLTRPDLAEAPELVRRFVHATPGVHHVLLSEQGAGQTPSSSWVARVEESVRTAERWTILRPSWFFQNLTDVRLNLSEIRENDTISLPIGSAEIAWIDAADIAAVAVQTVLHPSRYVGRQLTLTGAKTWTTQAIATELSRQLGREVVANSPSIKQATADLDGWLAQTVRSLYTRVTEGYFSSITDTVQSVTNSPPNDLATFIARSISHWKPSSGPESGPSSANARPGAAS